MATTKIWKIKKRFDNGIDYITNKDKTNNKKYVTGINCVADIAFKEMSITKYQFNKTGGILGFHAYQSFKGCEVTADEAHEIGIRLAEELWGDRFQIVVTTHTNTKNVHNHFAINSVSFIDGKKYYDNKTNYAIMRKVSDNICKEYELQTLKEKRYIRVEKSFGEEYSKESILFRIKHSVSFKVPFPEVHTLIGRYKRKNKTAIRHKQKAKGLQALYLYYCYLLKVFPKQKYPPKYSKAMKEEIKKMDDYSNSARFLAKYNITTLTYGYHIQLLLELCLHNFLINNM